MRRVLVGVVLLVLAAAAGFGAMKWKQLAAVQAASSALEAHRAPASKQADRVRKLADVVKAQPALDSSTVTIPMSGVSFVEGAPATGAFVDVESPRSTAAA